MSAMRRFLRRLNPRRLLADRSGMAAVEFAVLAPVVLGVLAATTDLGLVLYTRFQVDGAVNGAANYALVNGSSVSSSGASGLASTLSSYVYSSLPGSDGGAAVTVNNGATQTSGSGASTSGGGGSADACYCPTGSGAAIAWGGSVSCGTACPSGAYAGKFVMLSAVKPFTPLFSDWGIVKAGAIRATTIIQVQ